MSTERDEAAAAAQLDLRAHQMAVHLLGQRDYGPGPLAEVFAEAETYPDALALCCTTLGVLLAAMPWLTSHEIADTLRDRIPALILRAEGVQ